MDVLAMQVLCDHTDMAHTRSQVAWRAPGTPVLLVDLTGYQAGLTVLSPPSLICDNTSILQSLLFP